MDACPHCGGDLRPEVVYATGEWVVSPVTLSRRLASGELENLHLTPQQHRILYILVRGQGKPMSNDAIAWRMTEDGCGNNQIAVQICRLRRALGDPKLIENIWGKGYRWALPVKVLEENN